ncbi:MAG TPA: bifunctional oligoribonuclease/PAP phosphatase NrnA [Abditibacteriaceae bacterium]
MNVTTPPFEAISDAIAKYDTFLIVAHVGPDGDAIGSALALRMALESQGKKAWVVSTDGVPPSCRYLPQWKSVVTSPPTQPQCLFVLDCDGTQPRVAAPYHLIENARYKILIDHHRTSKPSFDVNWIDPAQSATALMIYQLLEALHFEVTPEIAQCLLCGMSTDTGNFRFPNTTPSCLHAAADLVSLGADPAETAFKLFDERSFGATRLLGIALQKMESECDGELIWTALTVPDFDAAQAGDEGSENVVNFLRNVRGARMAIIMRERYDETGPVARVSVRAEPEIRADLFAAQFGGGGHAAASGFRVQHKSYTDSVAFVVQSACKWIAQEHPPVENTVN